MAGLAKVKPGDPLVLTAEAYNAFVDAANFAQEQRGGGDPGRPDRAAAGATIYVKNNSGAAVPWHGLLSLEDTSPVLEPAGSAMGDFLEAAALTAGAPADDGESFC